MSRWGKARPQPFTLPLDALVKEKENTNRPIAARSAGTVGKWGITSFTSIRARPVYGFASFNPKNESFQFSSISPRTSIDGQGHLSTNACTPEVAPVAKPKKFFKSRNAIPEPEIPPSQSLASASSSSSIYNQQNALAFLGAPSSDSTVSTASSTKNLKIKINKNQLGKGSFVRKPKAEKVKVEKVKVEKVKVEKVKVEKVKAEKPIKVKAIKKKPAKESKPVKPPEQPTRILGRARKTINYSEDKSRSPTPVRSRPAAANFTEPIVPAAAAPFPSELQSINAGNANIDEIRSQFTPGSPSKNADHPPIVLRISKGTSRLISTDSEGINNSPPYLSPQQQQYQFCGTSTSVASAAAALVAVLSDDRDDVQRQLQQQQQQQPPPQPPVFDHSIEQSIDTVPVANNQRTKRTTVDKPKAKPEPIKIKIKTNITNELNASSSSSPSVTDNKAKNKEPAVRRGRPARGTRNNKLTVETIDEQALDTVQATVQATATTAAAVATAIGEIATNTLYSSPQPGSAGYELYQTLTKSPSDDKDFDSQSSLLGSVGSTLATPNTCPAESCVIQYRSSDATTDQDTSQDSSLVAPPSETDVRLAAMLDSDCYPNQEELTVNSPDSESSVLETCQSRELRKGAQPIELELVTKRRGRPPRGGQTTTISPKKRGKTAIAVDTLPKRNTRAKRGAAAAAVDEVDDINASEPAIAQQPFILENEVVEKEEEEEKEVALVKRRRKVVEHSTTVSSEQTNTSTLGRTRGPGRRGTRAQLAIEPAIEATQDPPQVIEEAVPKSGRASRSKTNGNMMQEKEPEMPVPTRSYGRKRKPPPIERAESPKTLIQESLTVDEDAPHLLPDTNLSDDVNINLNFLGSSALDENKVGKTRGRRKNMATMAANGNTDDNDLNRLFNANAPDDDEAMKVDDDEDKPSVKLVISKKKGSIFKSRAIDVNSGDNKITKRHVYKHKWDDDENVEKQPVRTDGAAVDEFENDPYSDEFADNRSGTNSGNASGNSCLARVNRLNPPFEDSPFDDEPTTVSTGRTYTRVRNVKRAHQMQEIGEFQEMDDDVEYILESLKKQNPIATRSLAAIQLASKCMTPAFRMHVRAHGTATKFFGALHDATQNQSLGLCTATIMFVLIQDNLNIDLDKHSLELMLNLLDTDVSQKNFPEESGLTDEQIQRNEQKVLEICREIKNQGKAVHLNLDTVSTGTLAMEALLTLTSKRAGEWFKDELRTLGGLEHIINTICECCKQISDYVLDWTESLLEKLRKIERCLRVLENVSERNEDNQNYILRYRSGHAVETLTKLYKLCCNEMVLNPTTEITPNDHPGVVLREALIPLLKVLINLTHTFNLKPLGCIIFGEKEMLFDTSLHLLLQASNYVPEKFIFELSLLVLLLLINLAMYWPKNRITIMNAHVSIEKGIETIDVLAIKALIEYFYKYEELARFVEQNTDDMLNNPANPEKAKHKSQEEIEETVSTLLQKAGNHMEHTLLASYVCLLVGHLVMDSKPHEIRIREYLRNGKFDEMVQILDKYYNFMNLTASSEAIQVAHMKETKKIIQYLKISDVHSKDEEAIKNDLSIVDAETIETAATATTSIAVPRQTYGSSASSSSSSSSTSRTDFNISSRSNDTDCDNAFNRIFFSGR